MSTLRWPEGATHVRLIANGATIIADRKTAPGLITRRGQITFLKEQRTQKFIALTGPVKNPLARRTKRRKHTKSMEQNEQERTYRGKGKFIDALLDGTKTAHEIAELVVKEFPEPNMTHEEQMKKALGYTRSRPHHLRERGITAMYAGVKLGRPIKNPMPPRAESTEIVESQ